jgi:cytidyltransferase-like protein
MNFTQLKISDFEEKIIKNNINLKYDNHSVIDYKNGICIKPWGYEFLIFQNKKIGIWFLNIKNNESTSIHTHFNKDTFVICVNGCGQINLINNEMLELREGSSIFIPHYKFHGLTSISKESFFVEIEIYNESINFSDKNDLLRINDQYKRKDNIYEKSVNFIINEIEKYNYFYLVDGFEKIINSVLFKVHTINSKTDLDNLNKNDYNIILDGNIYKNMCCIKEGSNITNLNDLHFLNDEILILSLKFHNDNSKIIYNKEHLKLIISQLSKKNLILTSGCFDIIHSGHIHNLSKAKQLGDLLFVCLSNDEQIKRLKGESRPINNYNDRIDLLKSIKYIDYIIIYDETNDNTEEELDNIMKIVNPEYWVKGSDYNIKNILQKHPSLKNIKLFNNLENKSTTNIILKIKN